MTELQRLAMLWRAMAGWPANFTATPARDRKRAPFKSRWEATLRLLDGELARSHAWDSVLEVDVAERWWSPSTGRPRADAPVRSPGVILRFDKHFRDGRVEGYVFPCDTFLDWQDNVRAIALTLEALRAIDRYGASHGRQFAGFQGVARARRDDPNDGGRDGRDCALLALRAQWVGPPRARRARREGERPPGQSRHGRLARRVHRSTGGRGGIARGRGARPMTDEPQAPRRRGPTTTLKADAARWQFVREYRVANRPRFAHRMAVRLAQHREPVRTRGARGSARRPRR